MPTITDEEQEVEVGSLLEVSEACTLTWLPEAGCEEIVILTPEYKGPPIAGVAAAFLGGKPMNINQNRAPAARGATGAIEDSAPKTDKEFEALAGLINGKLSQYEGKKGHLVCLKALLKSATAPMSTDECKDLASFVSVLSNAKIQADRDKDKGKKKGAPKKKTIVASKQSANDYGDDYDDFGDF